MRILVVGAGAIGGYFGGRLLKAGRDVAFLVRPRRATELAKKGLVIRSRLGDIDWPSPPTIAAENLREPHDLILLSCKAYDLASAMESIATAVGPQTAILPLLNGMAHVDALDARFPGRALGGQCLISATVDPEGRIVHLGDSHILSFGERDRSRSARAEAIAAELSGAKFDARWSDDILQEMWEKWIFIATGAGITCLMRAAVGDIVAAGGTDLAMRLNDEFAAVATAWGHAPRQAASQQSRATFTAPGSLLTASMFRDIERHAPIEAHHIIGDFLRRGDEKSLASPLARIVYTHLKAYEARRAREAEAA